MSFLLLALLAVGPSPSQPLDATASQRGMVSIGTQTFSGLKTFVDGGIVADLKAGSALMGLPLCPYAPAGPGAVLTWTDAGVWCPIGGYAFFEFATDNGQGLGAECAGVPVTGAKGEVFTSFARSTVGYCTKSDYSLVSVAANQPRVMRGRPGARLGVLVEQDATNLVLQNSDLSQSQWTKSASMTCVKNATDPAGVASGASTCTASAANQTVLQGVTRTSQTNSTSAYVRRVTGTSGVFVTPDNGATWLPITSKLTTSWKRVVCRDVEGCMGGNCIVVPGLCVTSANPTVGFQIQASGDAIAIAKVQNETGIKPSSPIDTAATSLSRSNDSMYLDVPAFTVASLRLSVVGATHGNNEYGLMLSNGAAAPFITLYSASSPVTGFNNVGCLVQASGGTAASGTNMPEGGAIQYSCDVSSTSNAACTGGYCAPNGGAAVASTTRIYIGGAWTGGADRFQGVISNVCIDTVFGRCSDSRPSPPGNAIAWLGDSITHGAVSAPTYPAVELYRTYGMALSKPVQDHGYPGYGRNNLPPIWSSIRGYGWGSLIVLFGVNDLRVGDSAATIWAAMQPILDDAKSNGMRVTVVRVTPWGNYVQWTAGKQTETNSLWALQQAWCTANSMPCVDTSSLGTGNNLQAGYDSGDGLHPNSAGAAALTALVAAANP